eukprot:c15535_g1_i2.p1 GENE.c15535_g1_i2~~c15535_g1_i2.p1  ORF type:complete len:786 (+),score=193.13 c15535_g1_i2:55-2358(+)
MEKTPQEIETIRKGINYNPLFRYLDDEQTETLISSMKKQTFEPGSFIIQEEAFGDNFYVVDSGSVTVLQSSNDRGDHLNLGTLTSGQSFGEKAMLYDTRRSASVVAAGPVDCWVVDRPTFHKVLVSSKKKLAHFNEYATDVDPVTHTKALKATDFIRANLPREDFAGKSDDELLATVAKTFPRLTTLFQLVDRKDTGHVDFLEYCLYDVIASKPDPFLDFAFLMFDEKKKGYVCKDDVQRIMERKSSELFTFDMDSSLVKRFFGANGDRRLRFRGFSEFFLELQEELPVQAFLTLDKDNRGNLSEEDFIRLVEHFPHWRLPPQILDRVRELGSVNSRRKGVTYNEFVAFNNLLSHLPGVVTILKHAMSRNGNAPVSQDEFLKSAQMLRSVRPSPLELSIIYDLCDHTRTGRITVDDFMNASGLSAPPTTLPISPADAQTPAAEHSRFKEAVVNFLLGSVAGAAGACAVYPIDFVKTRLQNQPYDAKGKGTMYNGIIDCFRKSIRHEGVLGLYRGLPAQLVGVAPEKAIKLATNDLLRDLFSNKSTKKVDLPLEILAGGCAGGMQVFFSNPYELIKIRLQVQGAEAVNNPGFQRKGGIQLVREIGLAGLYKGASACWLRDIPFSAIYFPIYAHAKTALQGQKESLSKSDLFLAGAIAGAPAAYLVTPADVVKTRLQADSKSGKLRFQGLRDCFLKTYREEGFKVFYVGGFMRVFRSSPQFAVTLLVYELLQKSLAPSMESPRPIVTPPVSTSEYRQTTSKLSKVVPPI